MPPTKRAHTKCMHDLHGQQEPLNLWWAPQIQLFSKWAPHYEVPLDSHGSSTVEGKKIKLKSTKPRFPLQLSPFLVRITYTITKVKCFEMVLQKRLRLLLHLLFLVLLLPNGRDE